MISRILYLHDIEVTPTVYVLRVLLVLPKPRRRTITRRLSLLEFIGSLQAKTRLRITTGTRWAHKYRIRYYSDRDPTVRTTELWGRASTGLPPTNLPPWEAYATYHIAVMGVGMGGYNTAYSPEILVRILPTPSLFHARSWPELPFRFSGRITAPQAVQYDVVL